MFNYSRSYRLACKQDIQSVFARPYKITRKYLTVLYRPSQIACPRLAIVARKNYFPHAVDRNRLRRIVRESFRHHKDMLKGLDIIVLMRTECTALFDKAGCDKTGKKVLRDDIDSLWQLLTKSSKPA